MPPRNPSAWMWVEACELMARADRLHRQFFRPAGSHSVRPSWEPPVDIFETEQDYRFVIALPGAAPDSVEVGIEPRALTVFAERRLPAEPGALVHRLELPCGRFERRIELPPEPLELGHRELVDGCLIIILRKLR